MLLVPHTIVGVVVAAAVRQPVLAFLVAFLSHFALDCVPHWDPLLGKLRSKKFSGARGETLLFILTDFFIAVDFGLFFVWWALSGQASPPDIVLATKILFSAAMANLPDVLMAPWVFFGKKWGWLTVYVRSHSEIQTKLSLPWGLLPQAVVIAICLLLMLR